MEDYERECCIRGYHVYKEIWAAALGEQLVCEREPYNRYAVAVVKNRTVIGHLPRTISRIEVRLVGEDNTAKPSQRQPKLNSVSVNTCYITVFNIRCCYYSLQLNFV